MQHIQRTIVQTLVASALCGTAFAQTSGTPVRVGVIVSVTGPMVAAGAGMRESYQLAEKVVNQRGGLNGRPLQLVFEDDASNPDVAVTKVNALLNGGAVAVLGPIGLAATLATSSVTAPKNVLQIATSGIGLPVERERKCLLHMMPSQQLNAAALLSYAADGAKAQRVGVLYDSGYGQPIMNSMKEQAPKFGVNFVAAEKYDLAATDMSGQVAKLKAANPDLIILASSSPTPFRLLRQMNVTTPVVATIAATNYDTVKAMGAAAEGVVFTDYLVAEEPRPREKDFVDQFRNEYKKLPKNFEAAAWEAVMVAAQALKKAGPDAKGKTLCDAARGKHAGAHVDYDFSAPDMTGIQLMGYQYSTVKDGKFMSIPFKAKDRP